MKPHTLIFDCDGVVLNSNAVKTEAFFKVCEPFGHAEAEQLVNYHVAHGGISRFAKFEYFITHILQRQFDAVLHQQLTEQYGQTVYENLLSCELTPNLANWRQRLADTQWAIVSGGAEHELRAVFRERGIDDWFDLGIYGSPTPKPEILRDQFDALSPDSASFMGDSRYDYQCATAANAAFAFISDWTDVEDWRQFCEQNHIEHHPTVDAFLTQRFKE